MTAAAIRFLINKADADAETVADAVEWLVRQQDADSGAWPVVTSSTLAGLATTCGYSKLTEPNRSVFNTASTVQTLISWIDFVERRSQIEV